MYDYRRKEMMPYHYVQYNTADSIFTYVEESCWSSSDIKTFLLCSLAMLGLVIVVQSEEKIFAQRRYGSPWT